MYFFYLFEAISNFFSLGIMICYMSKCMGEFVFIHQFIQRLSFYSPNPLAFQKLFFSFDVTWDNSPILITSFKVLIFSCFHEVFGMFLLSATSKLLLLIFFTVRKFVLLEIIFSVKKGDSLVKGFFLVIQLK